MKFISILLSVLLVSCAANPKLEGDGELRHVFDQFKKETRDSNASQYFTDKMWKEYLEFRGNSQDAAFKTANNFPDELTVTGSMESIENNTGCLIVQGNDQQGQAMDYNITLVKSEDRWRFSDLSVTLYDPGQKRWLTKPVCDTEQKQLLWLEHMQQQAQ